MTDANIPLMNGQRLEVQRRDVDGVPVNRPVYHPADSVDPDAILAAALLLDGSGTASLVANGSVTPAKFFHTAEAEAVTVVRALCLSIADGSALVSGGFGGLAALTNGLAIAVIDEDGTTVLADLTAGLSVKSHGDLIALGADVVFVDATTALVAVRWHFETAIELAAGQRFQVTVRDDLTGLTAARAIVTGHTRSL